MSDIVRWYVVVGTAHRLCRDCVVVAANCGRPSGSGGPWIIGRGCGSLHWPHLISPDPSQFSLPSATPFSIMDVVVVVFDFAMPSGTEHLESSMGTPNLCEPCRALLRGSKVSDEPWTYLHHEDAMSFERALKLACDIWVRLWAAFNRAAGMSATSHSRSHPSDVTQRVLTLGLAFWDRQNTMGPGKYAQLGVVLSSFSVVMKDPSFLNHSEAGEARRLHTLSSS